MHPSVTTRMHANQAALHPIVTGIATELGAEWTVTTWDGYDDALHLVHADGRTIMVRFEGYQDRARLEFHPTNPLDVRDAVRELFGNRSYVEGYTVNGSAIRAAASKTPAALAKDVTRRLLPHLDAETTAVRERIAREQARRDTTTAVAGRLAAQLNVRPGRLDERGRSVSVSLPGHGGGARLEVSGDRVTFHHLTVDEDTAAAVLAVLYPPVEPEEQEDDWGPTPDQEAAWDARDGMESMYPRDREDGEGLGLRLPSYGD
jgi:hypothetical protein